MSEMVRVAFKVPAAAGSRATKIVQAAPAARGLRQLFAWIKELAFVPVRLMLLMVSGEVPLLVNVTDCA